MITNGILYVGDSHIDLRGLDKSCVISVWLNNIYDQYCVEIDYTGSLDKENHDYLGSIEYIFDYNLHRALAKEIKHLEVISKSNNAQSKLIERYSQLEILSWDVQEKEAQALLTDANAEAPLLRTLAEGRGIPLDVFRDKVLNNIFGFREATKNILLKQQRYEDSIKAAGSIESLDIIDVVF